jgi:hypothetical protein
MGPQTERISSVKGGPMKSECCGARCNNADPDNKCKCRCNGKYHGINFIKCDYPDERFKEITESFGGPIEGFVRRHKDKFIKCFCGHTYKPFLFMGYEHVGGLADANGVKWWIFAVCPKCKYELSYWKLPRRILR